MLKQRIITAVVLFAVIVAVLAWGRPAAWGVLMLPVMALTIHEWTRLLHMPAMPVVLPTLGLGVLYILARDPYLHAPGWLLPVLLAGLVAWIGVAFRSVFRVEPVPTSPWLVGVFMLQLWVSLYELRLAGNGVLLSAMAIVWLADIGAYFSGRAWGRRKLAPRVSPGKSWEGVWGGAALVVVTAGLLVLGHSGGTGSRFPLFSTQLAEEAGLAGMAFVLLVLVGLSVMGDLYESLLKRHAGVKDSGACLPGHGGMFDRIDALIPAMPACLLIWLLL